jgi:hypothetical protein
MVRYCGKFMVQLQNVILTMANHSNIISFYLTIVRYFAMIYHYIYNFSFSSWIDGGH